MVDSSGPTGPLNIGNLKDDTVREIFKRVVNQADSVVPPQRSINALRNVNQNFRAVVDSEFREETRSARFNEAMVQAGNSAGTTTANDIITYHGVDDPGTQNMIKEHAAMRDINAGMHPRAAIERNDVDDPGTRNMLKEHGAMRDINAWMDPRAAIERNDVDDPVTQNKLKEHAAMRDINAGMRPRAAIERNDVDDPVTQKTIARTVVKPHPFVAARKVTKRAIRGFFLAAGRRIRNRGRLKWVFKLPPAMHDIMDGEVAGTAINRNGVTDQVTQNTIKEHAAMRDIMIGMVADTAIDRNDVHNPHAKDRIKWRAAERDINAGVAARSAIERHGVDNQDMQDDLKEHALKRDINAGMAARTAQERHNTAATRTPTRGLDERSRQEEGRGR
ncbi:hypothetical protein E0H39_37845 [Rhizobium leguminosarum bv. viciae]|uniref:hypothetical protein n=1 Tax=Rhizobium leguminosarum TaxID=384 RepID=UPI0010391A39|nr:hypothetical protein [Rhizobium leguminosarum]TBY52516.1 hypothetical protein E0H39_37845 [Rhizobium leguminosarum bv. viciae]